MATQSNQTISGSSWTDLNTLTGIVAGTEFSIMNLSSYNLLVHETAGGDPGASDDGKVLTSVDYPYADMTFPSGSDTIWVKPVNPATSVTIAVNT